MRTPDRALLPSEPRSYRVEPPARSRRRQRMHVLITAAFVFVALILPKALDALKARQRRLTCA